MSDARSPPEHYPQAPGATPQAAMYEAWLASNNAGGGSQHHGGPPGGPSGHPQQRQQNGSSHHQQLQQQQGERSQYMNAPQEIHDPTHHHHQQQHHYQQHHHQAAGPAPTRFPTGFAGQPSNGSTLPPPPPFMPQGVAPGMPPGTMSPVGAYPPPFSNNAQQHSNQAAFQQMSGSGTNGDQQNNGLDGNGVPLGFIPRPEDETKQRALYVGNLDPRVNEELLTDIFATAGSVVNVKIVPDRSQGTQQQGLNYGFVEFVEHETAELALHNFNGRHIFDAEIKVNWAFQGTQQKEDTSNHHHIFIGDLSPEINEDSLGMAFKPFGSLSESRIMWDPKTGKSRGYGFVSFRERHDAEQAITTMNGEWLGSRQIRVNWANQKTQAMVQADGRGEVAQIQPKNTMNTNVPGILNYEDVAAQSGSTNCTVYVGNLPAGLAQEALIGPFAQYGYVMEVRIQQDRGFGFVKMDTHHTATLAIVALNGQKLFGPNGIRCSWGRDRTEG